MALKRISDLTVATTPLGGTEELELDVAGSARKCTAQDIADLAGTPAAEDVTYDNAVSGLTATDVQGAIDEIAASPPGAAAWGGITGTLSDQTDLQAALDAKAQDRRTVTAAASTSGVLSIDAGLGDYFTHALDENVTSWSFSNLPGSGKGATLMIRITQDSTPRTVAWPASFKWAGGSAGSVSTASGAVDVLAITTFDNGTTWDATLAKAFA